MLTVSKLRSEDRRTAILLLTLLLSPLLSNAAPLRERCATFVPALTLGIDLWGRKESSGTESAVTTGWVKLSWPLDRAPPIEVERLRLRQRAHREALRARIDALTERRAAARDSLEADETQAEIDALSGDQP
jgi:hypothetical protein